MRQVTNTLQKLPTGCKLADQTIDLKETFKWKTAKNTKIRKHYC